MDGLSHRMAEVETHCENLLPIRTEIDSVKTDIAQTNRIICSLENRLDGSENRSQRNNLILYGIRDKNSSESSVESEQLITDHCNELVEHKCTHKGNRTHASPQYYCVSTDHPIIVKLAFDKTKKLILANGRKLKDTGVSGGEDFSKPVRPARKHFVAFAKDKRVVFDLPFNIFFIGPKRHYYDTTSETVNQIS